MVNYYHFELFLPYLQLIFCSSKQVRYLCGILLLSIYFWCITKQQQILIIIFNAFTFPRMLTLRSLPSQSHKWTFKSMICATVNWLLAPKTKFNKTLFTIDWFWQSLREIRNHISPNTWTGFLYYKIIQNSFCIPQYKDFSLVLINYFFLNVPR